MELPEQEVESTEEKDLWSALQETSDYKTSERSTGNVQPAGTSSGSNAAKIYSTMMEIRPKYEAKDTVMDVDDAKDFRKFKKEEDDSYGARLSKTPAYRILTAEEKKEAEECSDKKKEPNLQNYRRGYTRRCRCRGYHPYWLPMGRGRGRGRGGTDYRYHHTA